MDRPPDDECADAAIPRRKYPRGRRIWIRPHLAKDLGEELRARSSKGFAKSGTGAAIVLELVRGRVGLFARYRPKQIEEHEGRSYVPFPRVEMFERLGGGRIKDGKNTKTTPPAATLRTLSNWIDAAMELGVLREHPERRQHYAIDRASLRKLHTLHAVSDDQTGRLTAETALPFRVEIAAAAGIVAAILLERILWFGHADKLRESTTWPDLREHLDNPPDGEATAEEAVARTYVCYSLTRARAEIAFAGAS